MGFFELTDGLYRAKTVNDEWQYGYFIKAKNVSYIVNNKGKHIVAHETLGMYVGEGVSVDGRSVNTYSGDIIILCQQYSHLLKCVYELGVIYTDVSNLSVSTYMFYTPNTCVSIGEAEHYYVVGNIDDLDFDLAKLKNIQDKTNWLRENVRGKGSKKLLEAWTANSINDDEKKIYAKYNSLAEAEINILRQSRNEDNKELNIKNSLTLLDEERKISEAFTKMAIAEIKSG